MLKDKVREIWLKLLKEEARHRTKIIQRHEKRLIEIELEMKKNGS